VLTINEIFYSLQGEGMRAGTANVFVRFSGCNLQCRIEPGEKSPGGFDCDTEFASGRRMSLEDVVVEAKTIAPQCRWLILTGGEPGLQITQEMIEALHREGYNIAVETNGSIALPDAIDWITVSPKVAEHALRQLRANELRYVRAHGQGIPRPSCQAEHKLISPAFEADGLGGKNLSWCIELVKQNPSWRLSVQMHKFLSIR
jgi:organic radical activating enzyme